MKIPAVGDKTGFETTEEENKGLETSEKPAAAALVKEVESYQQAGLAVVTLDLTGLPGKSPDIHLGLKLNKADSLPTIFFTVSRASMFLSDELRPAMCLELLPQAISLEKNRKKFFA